MDSEAVAGWIMQHSHLPNKIWSLDKNWYVYYWCDLYKGTSSAGLFMLFMLTNNVKIINVKLTR